MIQLIAELQRSPIIIRNSQPIKPKKFGCTTVRPYKVLLLACAANCTTGTILAITQWKGEGGGNGAIEASPENRARKLEKTPK